MLRAIIHRITPHRRSKPVADPIVTVELPIVLKPVNDLLTALQQPGVNTQTVFDDFKTALLQEMANSPAAQSALINVVAAQLQAKLNAALPAAAA